MSTASDLVPRIVLCVTDLERKNTELQLQLQEQEDERLLIQITGPNRSPIYYERSLKDGGPGLGRHEWCNDFDKEDEGNTNNNNDILLPFSSLTDSEIWLSGILIETFQDVTKLFRLSSLGRHRNIQMHPGTGGDTGREMNQSRTHIVGGRSPVICIDASIIGPMTDSEFLNLTSEPFLEEQLAFHDDLHLKIRAIFFLQTNISGAISLLDKLGFRTSSGSDDE
mmetsp:Transcript_22863/g.25472  ORF Transcript_22863/g.25472 Transcript_22863/m.25472 type:complete len:224 (-) Transcript_22863:102-773(-)